MTAAGLFPSLAGKNVMPTSGRFEDQARDGSSGIPASPSERQKTASAIGPRRSGWSLGSHHCRLAACPRGVLFKCSKCQSWPPSVPPQGHIGGTPGGLNLETALFQLVECHSVCCFWHDGSRLRVPCQVSNTVGRSPLCAPVPWELRQRAR